MHARRVRVEVQWAGDGRGNVGRGAESGGWRAGEWTFAAGSYRNAGLGARTAEGDDSRPCRDDPARVLDSRADAMALATRTLECGGSGGAADGARGACAAAGSIGERAGNPSAGKGALPALPVRSDGAVRACVLGVREGSQGGLTMDSACSVRSSKRPRPQSRPNIGW